MKLRLPSLAWFAAALVATGCSSTRFVSSETAADAGPSLQAGQKVVALVVDPRVEVRNKAETALAAELTRRGLEGIPAHAVVSADDRDDKEKMKAAIHASGAEILVATHLVGIEEKQQVVPGVHDRDVDFYGTGWSINYAPGYFDSYGIFTVETRCYRVADEKLLWAGISETVDPADGKDLVRSLAKEAGKVMRKQGLVAKK